MGGRTMGGSVLLRLGLGLLLLAVLLPPVLDAQDTTPAPASTQSTAGGGDASSVSALQSSVSVLVLSLSFLLHLYC